MAQLPSRGRHATVQATAAAYHCLASTPRPALCPDLHFGKFSREPSPQSFYRGISRTSVPAVVLTSSLNNLMVPHKTECLSDTATQQLYHGSVGPGETLKPTPRLNLGHRFRGYQTQELLPVSPYNPPRPLRGPFRPLPTDIFPFSELSMCDPCGPFQTTPAWSLHPPPPIHSRLSFQQRRETGHPPQALSLDRSLLPCNPARFQRAAFLRSQRFCIETTTLPTTLPTLCRPTPALFRPYASTEPLYPSLHRSYRSDGLPTRLFPQVSAVPTEATTPRLASLPRFPPLPQRNYRHCLTSSTTTHPPPTDSPFHAIFGTSGDPPRTSAMPITRG